MPSILLIEDNTGIKDTTGEMLELAGYEVVTTPCGEEGIALAHQLTPDLIICDVWMPKVDGYKVLNQLKKNPLTAPIPFVFFSASTDAIHIRKGLKHGALDYLCKPFTEQELLNVVSHALHL